MNVLQTTETAAQTLTAQIPKAVIRVFATQDTMETDLPVQVEYITMRVVAFLVRVLHICSGIINRTNFTSKIIHF